MFFGRKDELRAQGQSNKALITCSRKCVVNGLSHTRANV